MNKIKELEAELLEQCRLLGKSGEREAKHLSEIETLKRENLKLTKKIEKLTEMHNSHVDTKKDL